MLVLSRERNETIVIGEPGPNQIRVTLVDILGNKARLGILAPAHLPVHREEVYDAIQRENVRIAAKQGPTNCAPEVCPAVEDDVA